MTNALVGDHQVVVVEVDEGVLEGSDTATWGSPTSEFVIKVNLTYYTCFIPNFSQGIH